MKFQSKQLGYAVVGIAVVLALLTYSYSADIVDAEETACKQICGEPVTNCPHTQGVNLPVQSYLGITLVLALAVISYFLITSNRQASKESKKLTRKIKNLPPDEKKLYDILDKADGAEFQGELVKRTDFSKSKVSRLLDVMEGKGIVEKRRRGMSNLILLKNG